MRLTIYIYLKLYLKYFLKEPTHNNSDKVLFIYIKVNTKYILCIA